MQYGYRVAAQYSNRDAGLVGLASTRTRAAALARTTRGATRIRRERWTTAVVAAVKGQEATGQIPRCLPLSVAAKGRWTCE